MNILLTGGSGFIGKYLIPRLLNQGHNVFLVIRNPNNLKFFDTNNKLHFIVSDLSDFDKVFNIPGILFDVLIHLAWEKVRDCNSSIHLKKNFPHSKNFVLQAIKHGIKHLIISGTCLEYGMREGELSEHFESNPITNYAISKNMLREYIEKLKITNNFIFQWVRIFYVYGEGQDKDTILGQLDHAIDKGDEVFNMSIGNQLRDYLPVEVVADNLCLLLNNPDTEGIVNCCSGNPISILDLVKKRCCEKKINIPLNPGFFDIPKYEPLNFWGDATKIDLLRKGLL